MQSYLGNLFPFTHPYSINMEFLMWCCTSHLSVLVQSRRLVCLKCGFFFIQCSKRSSICILPCFSNTILTAYRSGTRVLKLRPYYPSKGVKSFLLIHSGKSFILETWRVIIQWIRQSKWSLKSDSLTKQSTSMSVYFIRLVGILGSKGHKSSLSTYNITKSYWCVFQCIGMIFDRFGGYMVTIRIAKMLKWSFHRFIFISFRFGFDLLKIVWVPIFFFFETYESFMIFTSLLENGM